MITFNERFRHQKRVAKASFERPIGPESNGRVITTEDVIYRRIDCQLAIATALTTFPNQKKTSEDLARMRTSLMRAVQFKWPKQGGPMLQSLTYTAKLSQMPFRYYFKTGWMFRYGVYAWILTFPLWVFIHRKVNSPAAVAAWEAKKAQDKHHEHIEHMWKDISGWNANK